MQLFLIVISQPHLLTWRDKYLSFQMKYFSCNNSMMSVTSWWPAARMGTGLCLGKILGGYFKGKRSEIVSSSFYQGQKKSQIL